MQSSDLNSMYTAMFSQFFEVLWQFRFFLALPFLILFARLAVRLLMNQFVYASGIEQIDKLNGEDFERYLQHIFKKRGYSVKRTSYRGDYGADLVVSKGGVTTVIQAKRYKRNVGVKAVQEVLASKGYYRCQAAAVLTNSLYTQQARRLAKANDVILWDRNDLARFMKEAGKPEEKLPKPTAA